MTDNDAYLIRKYANRRLYDTVRSRHVTLAGLKQLVVDGKDVRVVDDTSGEDITRTIFLQVIAEQEADGVPILDSNLLLRLIRLHGDPLQDMVGDYLRKSLDVFLTQQRELQEKMRDAMLTAPLETMRQMAATQVEAWQAWQSMMLGQTDVDEDAEITPTPDDPDNKPEI